MSYKKIEMSTEQIKARLDNMAELIQDAKNAVDDLMPQYVNDYMDVLDTELRSLIRSIK